MVDHRRVAVARAGIAIDPADGTQPGAIVATLPFAIEFQQDRLPNERHEVELAVLDQVGVGIEWFDLIELVDRPDGNAGPRRRDTADTPWPTGR